MKNYNYTLKVPILIIISKGIFFFVRGREVNFVNPFGALITTNIEYILLYNVRNYEKTINALLQLGILYCTFK